MHNIDKACPLWLASCLHMAAVASHVSLEMGRGSFAIMGMPGQGSEYAPCAGRTGWLSQTRQATSQCYGATPTAWTWVASS